MDSARRNLRRAFGEAADAGRPVARRETSPEFERALEFTNRVMAPGTDPRFHAYSERRAMAGQSAQAMTDEQIRYNQAERYRHKAFDAVRHIVNDYQWSVIQQKNKDDVRGATKAFAEALVQAFLLGQKSIHGE